MKKIFVVCFVIVINQFINPQTKSEEKDSSSVNTSSVIEVSKIKQNLITVDGILNESVWDNIVSARNFVEYEPKDNVPASVETEVKILYDDDKIYFGFICYDNDMENLRVNLSDRDKIYEDDFIGIILDTYGNSKDAVEVFINPYGIQGDGSWTPDFEDMSYDLIFESDAHIYKDRWTGEVAIPFKSLSFPDKEEQSWKIHIVRTRPRESRVQMSWIPISRDEPELFSKSGTLKGIKNVKRGKNIEVLPYVIASQSGSVYDIGDPNSEFISEKIKGNFGVGLKYNFTSNLTGEVVYNPDFSQIESDATQIDINSSSAIFYPEKRPFFLEGSNIFRTRITTVYTRMLNDPILAAKLIGKIGNLEVGYLFAYDENTPFIVPNNYGNVLILADSMKSISNVLRVKHNLKGESFLGMIVTDREVDKGYNRVLGFDGNINFLKNFYLSWQLMGYFTKEINNPDLYNSEVEFGNKNFTPGFNGEYFSGIGGVIGLQRKSRDWNFGINYFETPSETRRDLGYVGRVNLRELNGWQSYMYYPKSGIAERIEAVTNFGVVHDYSGKLKDLWVIPSCYIKFKKLIYANIGYILINSEEYYGVFHKNVNRGWLNLQLNTSQVLQGGFWIELGKYIVRFEYPSYVGWGLNGDVWLTYKPMDRFSAELNYSYSELSDKIGGNVLYAGYILRNKITYQFSKKFFLRLITQYDLFSNQVNIDPLLSYKWNPFTIFYIGSSQELIDYKNINSTGTSLKETKRQFFAKFQYLFNI